MDIGSKIKRIRKEQNLSQEQLAERYHVTRQTVSNWENNKNYPDMDTLRQLSDDFHMSFDVLLKDDIEWIGEIDKTRKKAISRKKIIIMLVVLFCIALAAFIWSFVQAFEATADGDRINTDTDVRMLVDLPEAAPSRAITYTVLAGTDSQKTEERLYKLKELALGKIEGDIPAVFTSENPKITLHFQDLYYSNLKSMKILSVEAELENVVSLEKIKRKLDFDYQSGKIFFHFGPEFVTYDGDDSDWYKCIITAQYLINDQEYISITALTVMKERYL